MTGSALRARRWAGVALPLLLGLALGVSSIVKADFNPIALTP